MSKPVRTRFENRRHRIKIHRRDLVGFLAPPALEERLERLDREFVNAVTAADPLAVDFLDWWADEATRYGMPVRGGLAALYYSWHRADDPLDVEHYADLRDALAETLEPVVVGEELETGRTIMQELIWWSAGDWLLATHLIDAIDEFREYHASGRFPDWRRRKRRRLAAARRKAVKSLYAEPPEGRRLRFLKDREEEPEPNPEPAAEPAAEPAPGPEPDVAEAA